MGTRESPHERTSTRAATELLLAPTPSKKIPTLHVKMEGNSPTPEQQVPASTQALFYLLTGTGRPTPHPACTAMLTAPQPHSCLLCFLLTSSLNLKPSAQPKHQQNEGTLFLLGFSQPLGPWRAGRSAGPCFPPWLLSTITAMEAPGAFRRTGGPRERAAGSTDVQRRNRDCPRRGREIKEIREIREQRREQPGRLRPRPAPPRPAADSGPCPAAHLRPAPAVISKPPPNGCPAA